MFYILDNLFMAITLKPILLKHQRRSDNTYNVKIRVTLNRKSAYIPTEHYIGPKQISKDFKTIKDDFINDELYDDVRRLRLEISRLGARVNSFTVKELAEYLLQRRIPGTIDEIDFIAFSTQKADELMDQGRRSVSFAYKAMVKHLKNYIKKNKLDIKEITVKFLRKYEIYLTSLDNMGSRGIESNLSSMRALFNLAKDEYNDEDTGDIKIVHNPFSRYVIPKSEEPNKRSLTIEQIIKIKNFKHTYTTKYDPKKDIPQSELARDVYMMSFYLVGINSIDLFHLEKIEDGRITYQRSKTKGRRSDKAEISVKLEPEVLPLIEKYRDPAGNKAFCFYHKFTTDRGFNTSINRGLKKIGAAIGIASLEYYSARHSWATIARNDCDITKDDIALCLNHTDPERKTTDKYIKKDWSRIDKSNSKVLQYMREYDTENKIASPK